MIVDVTPPPSAPRPGVPFEGVLWLMRADGYNVPDTGAPVEGRILSDGWTISYVFDSFSRIDWRDVPEYVESVGLYVDGDLVHSIPANCPRGATFSFVNMEIR